MPRRAYTRKALHRLARGRHTLVGKWVRIINPDRVVRTKNRFLFKRDDPVLRAGQRLLRRRLPPRRFLRRLGFKHVNAHSRRSASTPSPTTTPTTPWRRQDRARRGGVDDAEDVEVIWHEYGHAVQDDQVPDFGISAAGRCDRRGVRRLPGRRDEPDAPTAGTKQGALGLRDGLGLDRRYLAAGPQCLRRVDTEPHEQRLRRVRPALEQPDLLAGALGHQPGPRPHPGDQG